MSKLITEQDYSDELTKFYENEYFKPSKPFPLYTVDRLLTKKDKINFGISNSLQIAAIVLLFVSITFTLVGIPFIGAYGLLGLLGVAGAILLGETSSKYYINKSKHIEISLKEGQKSTAYTNAYRTWLNDRYNFPIEELTDDVLASSVFVIGNKYFAKVLNDAKDEITFVREASEEEIAVYENVQQEAKKALKEAPLSDKVKDEVEVTYL